MKVIIAGSRDFNDYELLSKTVNESNIKITEIISGTARGADRLGERYAKENKIEIKRFPAEWEKFGRQAGYLRNKQMAEYGDALIAFRIDKSKGTSHMIELARKNNLQVIVVEI